MQIECDYAFTLLFRKIKIPYRLSRKNKSKRKLSYRSITEQVNSVWKYIPNDEHWITFNIEMLTVEEWTLERQFQFMDLNNDTYLTQSEVAVVHVTLIECF